MSKRPKPRPPDFQTTKKTYNNNRYITIFNEMLDSPAWVMLSDGAKNVYLVIAEQYRGMYTGNRVKCPYSTMKTHGIRTQSIPAWLVELEALGFLKVSTHGGLYKTPNEYTLIGEWSQIKSLDEARNRKKVALDRWKAMKETRNNKG